MSFASILLLAVGLAMDATAVAAARGLASRGGVRASQAVRLALMFGAFQAGMPVIGWLAGARIGPLISAWDHWIAFALLGGIGAKMLWEARSHGDDDVPTADHASPDAAFSFGALTVLAVATSIDALAVGVTLPMLNAPLGLSIGTIGVVTALLSFAGVYVGRRFGASLGRGLDAFGGLVLIGIGTRILIAHLRGGQ